LINLKPGISLKKILLIIICLTVSAQAGMAQCCAPGNPVSGSEYVGILPKKTLRTITYYRHSYSDTYYEGSEKSVYQGTHSGYDFFGEVLSYGIIKKLTVEAELGYYVYKYQESELVGKFTTYGFTNSTVSLKYAIVKTKKDMELTLGAGAKVPLSRKVFRDDYGVPYPQDIQPSTGAFGFVGQVFFYKSFMEKKWKIVALARYEINGYNSEDYRFGNALFTSVFVGRSFAKNWAATLQLRNEYRREDWQGDTRYLVTGGDILYVSPQVSYTFKSRLTLSVTADIPVFRHYNGIQLGPKYAFGISVVKDFCL
jgi:hypothetical protein